NEVFIIVKEKEDTYKGFILRAEEQKDLFLSELELTQDDTNALIKHVPSADEFLEEPFAETDPVLTDESLPTSTKSEARNVNFKPKAHILTLLGEELIKDPVMAIYELVKNSYDADA